MLPSDTTAAGPPSGAAIGTGPFLGVTPPFATQPVQGFSGILPAGDGDWLAMPDNGFGRRENSADWLLRVYRVGVGFETASGGDGTAGVVGFLELRDPGGMFPFPLVRPDRLLTGADVDPESIFEDSDGTFWVGDEFGPWMLHFDASGSLLEPPISLPGVRSPQNPELTPGEAPTLDRSKGFEAAAPSANGRRAYVFLEGALINDADQRRRYVYELDPEESRFTGRRWAYRTEDPAWLVADAKLLDGRRLLVMERDDFEGTGVRFKKVFEVDLGPPGGDRFVPKREVLDLLDLRDPDGISLPAQPGDRGLGLDFSFPLRSIESIWPLAGGRVVVANDNNYPFDAGRHDGVPDGNEWIVVRPATPEVVFARRELRAEPRERVKVACRLAREASVLLELRGDGRVVERKRFTGRTGNDAIQVRAPREPGHYTLHITATLGNLDDSDSAKLIVR